MEEPVSTNEAATPQVPINQHTVRDAVHDDKEVEAVVTKSTQDASLDEKSTAQAPSITVSTLNTQTVLSQLQAFFESASTSALALVLAIAVGSVAIVFGRIGLLIIGILGGALGHAAIQNDGGKSGLSTWMHDAKVALDLDTDSSKAPQVDKLDKDQVKQLNRQYPTLGLTEDLSSLPAKTASALSELSNAIVRDYVRWWYSPLIPTDASFPASCHQYLTSTIVKLSNHLSTKRPADMLLLFLYSSSNTLIVLFRELAAMTPSTSMKDDVVSYIDDQPSSALASMVDRTQQDRRMHIAAEELIGRCVPLEGRLCEPVASFLRETLSSLVFGSMADKFSEADWINSWIVYLLEDTGPQSTADEGVGNLLRELDKGVTGAASVKKPAVTAVQEKERVVREESRRGSRSDEAMDQAMREAQELTRMIVEAETIQNASSSDQAMTSDDLREQPNEQITDPKAPTDTIGNSVSDHASELSTRYLDSEEEAHKKPTLNDHTLDIEVPDTKYDIALPDQAVSTESFDEYSDDLGPQTLTSPLSPTTTRGDSLDQPALLRARITITDLSPQSNPPKILKSRPASPFMLQVEPLKQSGWIIMRRYQDFETLHEVLRRIAAVSGVHRFLMAYSDDGLPTWKGRASDEVAANLELYLRIVLDDARLVECDAFKKFMEKDEERKARERGESVDAKPLLQSKPTWPTTSAFKNMGEGVLGAITKAPQSATEGSKALFGNVFTAVQEGVGAGRKKQGSISTNNLSDSPKAATNFLGVKARGPVEGISNLLRIGTNSTSSSRAASTHRSATPSIGEDGTSDNAQPSLERDREEPREEQEMELSFEEEKPRLASRQVRRDNLSTPAHSRQNSAAPSPVRSSIDVPQNKISSTPTSQTTSPPRHEHMGLARTSSEAETLAHLPPPPSEIIDDYSTTDSITEPAKGSQASVTGPSSIASSAKQSPRLEPVDQEKSDIRTTTSSSSTKAHNPLTEQETQYAVDIFFSLISELYNLSSAWMLRRSLLNIAKSVLLRPGNASLKSIQVLIQESIVEANTTDEAIAQYVQNVRKNALPTEAETKQWEDEGALTPLSDQAKEELKEKARRLIGEKGLPEGLRGLMGGQASRESMERVFDCLQEKSVARGLMVSLITDTVRGICQ